MRKWSGGGDSVYPLHRAVLNIIMGTIRKHPIIFVKCSYSLLTDSGSTVLGTKET